MGINLLDLVRTQMGDELLTKAAGLLGEEQAATQRAMDFILPSVLGGLANKATNLNDADKLLSMLTAGKHDGSIFSMMGILLGGGSATQGLLNEGGNISHNLFGDRLSGIVEWIASHVGIKAGSASSLMNLVSPLLLGVIGKQIEGNPTASGLMHLLGSQLPILRSLLPTGLHPVLGLSNLNLTPSVPVAQKAATEDSLFNRLLPWLLLVAAGLAGLYYLRACQPQAPQPAAAPIVETPKVAPIAVAVKKLSLPNGEILVKAGSFLDSLYTEIVDNTPDPTKALTFDNLNFATNSAVLTDSSKTQLDDLVKIMKAYPNVVIKVEGHTDNIGNAVKNKKLSEDRAAAVKTHLNIQGIAATRVNTAGFGADKPIADNTTEEGRLKNRRIEAFVIKK
jgi:outer membrane protein OmpA-like peptidoglycan-associated protein